MTKLAGRTVTAGDFALRGFGMTCVETSGLSFAGAGVDATRVRVASDATAKAAAPVVLAGNGLGVDGLGVDGLGANGLAGNGLAVEGIGAWDARRIERPLSASVATMSALAGGYGDAAGAEAGAVEQQSLQYKHELQTQKFAASAMTMRALRGPDPWIDRT